MRRRDSKIGKTKPSKKGSQGFAKTRFHQFFSHVHCHHLLDKILDKNTSTKQSCSSPEPTTLAAVALPRTSVNDSPCWKRKHVILKISMKTSQCIYSIVFLHACWQNKIVKSTRNSTQDMASFQRMSQWQVGSNDNWKFGQMQCRRFL